MKDIALILGLKEDASLADILAAIEKLKVENDDLRTARTGIPKGTDLAALREKMAAGLSREQALEALANQAAHDKATETPKSKKEK